jgi:hypothetical protein
MESENNVNTDKKCIYSSLQRLQFLGVYQSNTFGKFYLKSSVTVKEKLCRTYGDGSVSENQCLQRCRFEKCTLKDETRPEWDRDEAKASRIYWGTWWEGEILEWVSHELIGQLRGCTFKTRTPLKEDYVGRILCCVSEKAQKEKERAINYGLSLSFFWRDLLSKG